MDFQNLNAHCLHVIPKLYRALIIACAYKTYKINAVVLEDSSLSLQKSNHFLIIPYLVRIIAVAVISRFLESASLVWALFLTSQTLLFVYRLRTHVYFSLTSEWWSIVG